MLSFELAHVHVVVEPLLRQQFLMRASLDDLSIVELAYSSANFRGIQGRVKYAEAFHSLRLFINI